MNESSLPAIRVYFDGGCPVCSREIAFYRRQPGAERIGWINLVGASEDELGPGLDHRDAMARLHVRHADGRLVSGARAFALLWLNLPRFRLAGRIAMLPVVVEILELGYRGVLKLRSAWRKPDPGCPLPSPPERGPGDGRNRRM